MEVPALAIPSTKVEIAFTSNFSTAEGSRTWTDVSAYVEGDVEVPITYGRDDELAVPSPNTVSVTLDNRDGRFTPGRTSSPYYPNVVKGKPVRVTVTYSAVGYVRFTGYIDDWPVVWPDGSSAACTVTFSGTSRRARMGTSAPLPSAIRAAYLATDPLAYWPMDEDADTVDRTGRQAFRDVTNAYRPGERETQVIAAFYYAGYEVVVHDGTEGPTDEQSLVKLPAFSDSLRSGTFMHYIGASTAVKLDPTAGLTAECVARVQIERNPNNANILSLYTPDLNQVIQFTVDKDDTSAYVNGTLYLADDTGAYLGDASAAHFSNEAVDEEIHHFAVTLNTAGTVAKFYFDGVLIHTLTPSGGVAFTKPLTQIVFGSNTYNATVWVGHGAVHDRVLSDAEVLAHAVGATTASETVEERVERLAGYLGVPAAEVDVASTIAATLGPQSEKDRSAAEVLDEVATSTSGVLHDDRDGHLVMQARNDRYTGASAFTLDATTQEVQSDLTFVLDDRYLYNTVEVTRVGSEDTARVFEDDTSIDAYGVRSTSIQMVSESDGEAEALGYDMLYRYAQPKVRVTQVTVDLANLSTAQRALVLAADIGTRFTLGNLPAQAPATSVDLFVEGASESITATAHTITFNTTPAGDYPALAVVGTALVGASTLVVY